MENRENSGKNLRNPSRLQSQTIGFDRYEILAFGGSPSCSVGDIVAKPRSYGVMEVILHQLIWRISHYS